MTGFLSTGARVALSLMAAPFAAGCLPGDTRPEPASLYVTVEPSQAVAEGVETPDGWRVAFERLVAGVGNIDFEQDDASCNVYAEAHYDRLFDFTVAGREKVGIAYGLGTCRVDFRLRSPSHDAVLGPGATADDVARMRTRGTDPFAEDERVSVLAIGTGSREGVTKRFHWLFRQSFQIESCQAEGGGFATTLDLAGGAAEELRLALRGEELLRAAPDDGAGLWFQPIADADGDGDGEVTLEELSRALRPLGNSGGLGGLGGITGQGAQPGDVPVEASLGYLMYGELLPRLLRVAGAGPCEAEERRSRR